MAFHTWIILFYTHTHTLVPLLLNHIVVLILGNYWNSRIRSLQNDNNVTLTACKIQFAYYSDIHIELQHNFALYNFLRPQYAFSSYEYDLILTVYIKCKYNNRDDMFCVMNQMISIDQESQKPLKTTSVFSSQWTFLSTSLWISSCQRGALLQKNLLGNVWCKYHRSRVSSGCAVT